MTSFQIRIYKDATHYITFDASTNATRVESRVFEWQENHPRKLRVTLWNQTDTASENLLSSSFNGWTDAVTGAVALGMDCHYIQTQTKFSDGTDETPDQYTIYGFITGIETNQKGRITLVVDDYLAKYETNMLYKTWYANYRDRYQLATGWYGTLLMADLPETTGYFPAVEVALAVNDTIFNFGTDSDINGNGTAKTLDTVGDAAAAPFMADHDGTYGFAAQVDPNSGAAGSGVRVRYGVQADSGGSPSGSWEFYKDVWYANNPGAPGEYTVAYWDGGTIKNLRKGAKYWFVMELMEQGDAGYSIEARHNTGGIYNDWAGTVHYKLKEAGGSWSDVTGSGNLCFSITYTDWERVDTSDYDYYTLTAGYDKIRFFAIPGALHAEDAYRSYYGDCANRGRASYYYGTFNIYNALNDLVAFEPGMTSSVTGSTSYNVPLYRCRGKSAADCMREICDLPCYSGGYQESLAHLYDGATHYIGTRRREKVGYDSACMTFAYGNDTTTDNYKRIINVNLQKTTKARPTKIIVVGKGWGGVPICQTVHDRGVSGSFYDASKLHATINIYDESLNTLQQVSDKAIALWEYYKKDTWEGQITVSGVYPQLINMTRGSTTEWSGRVIHLHYSPLGIDGDFRVTGVVTYENTTELSISNRDQLYENYVMNGIGKAQKSESFLSPDDPQDFFYFAGWKSATLSSTTYWMQLNDASHNALPRQHRVKVTETSNTALNLKSFQAFFSEGNADGLVEEIELYTTETGGSYTARYTIGTELGNVFKFPKWTTTSAIVELQYKSA